MQENLQQRFGKLFKDEWDNNIDKLYKKITLDKKMDKKFKLENLRKEIDAIDLKILDLISERKSLPVL